MIWGFTFAGSTCEGSDRVSKDESIKRIVESIITNLKEKKKILPVGLDANSYLVLHVQVKNYAIVVWIMNECQMVENQL